MLDDDLTTTVTAIRYLSFGLILLAQLAFAVVAALRVRGMPRWLAAGGALLLAFSTFMGVVTSAVVGVLGFEYEAMILAMEGSGLIFTLLSIIGFALVGAALWQWPRPPATA